MNRLLRLAVLLSAVTIGGCVDAGRIAGPAIPAEKDEAAPQKPVAPPGGWAWDEIGIASGCSECAPPSRV